MAKDFYKRKFSKKISGNKPSSSGNIPLMLGVAAVLAFLLFRSKK